MHVGVWIALVLIMLMAAAVVAFIVQLSRKLREAAGVLKTVRQGIDSQTERLSRTPKSVSAMGKIYEPQIARDFPQFNVYEYRRRAESLLACAFAALDSGGQEDVCRELPSAVKEQVVRMVEEDRQRGVTSRFREVKLHRTELAGYRKLDGNCIITYQTAVEYRYFVKRGGELISGAEEYPTQTRYNTELVYVQDAVLSGEHGGTGVGLTCPQCGAPVSGLGHKTCAYCGMSVVEMNLHVWEFNRFYEVKHDQIGGY